jgi:hypothetical protein
MIALTRNSVRKIIQHNKSPKVSNRKAKEGETFAEIGITKNTYLKACQEEDEDREIQRKNPKDCIVEIYNREISECDCKLNLGIVS